MLQQADTQKRGYLDFTDFKRFVKSLKSRPELDRLYKKVSDGSDELTFSAFERFMRTTQKVSPHVRHNDVRSNLCTVVSQWYRTRAHFLALRIQSQQREAS